MKLKTKRKALSILLTVAMLVTLLVPMVGPAAAASTYSVSSVKNVTAGQNFPGTFNRIIVEVPANQIAGTYQLLLVLPANYYTVPSATYGQAGSITGTDPNQVTNVVVSPAGGQRPSTTVPNPNAEWKEWQFMVTLGGAGSSYMGRFYIDLANFYVASGATGDINAYFAAAGSTPFSSANVKIASVGSGVTSLSITDVNMITSSAPQAAPSSVNQIGTIRYQEDRPGALRADAQALKIKLPNGFTWYNTGIPGQIWGETPVITQVITTTDNGRTLVVNNPAATTQNSAFYQIDGLKIVVDESVAKVGDVEATIDGSGSFTPSTLVVAKYGDFGATVSSSDKTTVLAGREGNGTNTKDTEIGKVIIQENSPGTLVTGRSITLTLTGGAKWNVNRDANDLPLTNPATVGRAPSIDSTNSDQQGLAISGWSFVGTEYDTIKTTITSPSSGNKGAKLVLEKGQIDLAADCKSDIGVTVGGTAGASGDAGVVATSMVPAALSIDGSAPDAIVGMQGQQIADVIVTEAVKEAISADNNANMIRLQFFQNVVPSLPTKVEVIDGDIVIDDSSVRKDVTNDGRWYIEMKIRSTSSKPSKIKFSGIKITTDRTTPEGPTKVELKGSGLLQTSANINSPFPGVTSMSATTVANIVTPTSKDSKVKATFKIGDAKYTANGVEKTMDVASYVENGRTYIPMRFAANALGVNDSNIIWNADSASATFIKGDKVVQVKDGSAELIVNGVTIPMDVAAQIKDGRFMVPFRFVAQAFGAAVSWDDATQTVSMDF